MVVRKEGAVDGRLGAAIGLKAEGGFTTAGRMLGVGRGGIVGAKMGHKIGAEGALLGTGVGAGKETGDGVGSWGGMTAPGTQLVTGFAMSLLFI